MLIKERLSVVNKAPFAHYGTTTAYYSTKTTVCEMHIMTPYASMNGEIVNTLFALLNKGVLINFP